MKMHRLVVALIMGLLVSAPVMADKPAWAGGGKHEREAGKRDGDRKERREDRGDDRVSIYFNADMRRVVGDYYGAEVRAGRCPPGLAKKNNGCLPPGQAKKWSRGHRLPADVHYVDLPHELLIRLPAPPLNHRYVQVAGDVLLIAVGTSMVVDALEDILR